MGKRSEIVEGLEALREALLGYDAKADCSGAAWGELRVDLDRTVLKMIEGSEVMQQRVREAEENAAIAERGRESATNVFQCVWARWAPHCACGRVSEYGCESWSGDPRSPKQQCRECYTTMKPEVAPEEIDKRRAEARAYIARVARPFSTG